MIGFAEVAALITILGAVIYGLGLLGVAWPIHKRWHNDAATTLYAISLIPRAVVAGQGVRIFMGFPTLIATLLLIWWLVVFPLLRLVDVVASTLAAWTVGIFALLALLAGGYGLLRSMYRRGIQWVLGPAPEHPRYRWLIWVTTLIAVPTFFIAGRVAAGAMEYQAAFPYIRVDLSLLVVAIALSFLASSLLQLVDATAIDPPLPTAEIALSDGSQRILEGKLLVHIEGVVYFFDEKRRLTSMPDSEISSVRIRKDES
jgi:hypothetical protein